MLFGSVIYFDFVFVNFVWICAGFLSCELSLVLMGIQFVVVVFRFFEILLFSLLISISRASFRIWSKKRRKEVHLLSRMIETKVKL
jgi:hypothetical protein